LQDSVRWENEVTGAEEKACGVQKSVALTDADSASTGGSGRGAEQSRARARPTTGNGDDSLIVTLALSSGKRRVGDISSYKQKHISNKSLKKIQNSKELYIF